MNKNTIISIALNIDDPNNFIKYCYINKQNKLLSHKSFWIKMFNKYELPMLNMHNNFNDWINEFKITYNTQMKVLSMLDKIYDKEYFYSVDFIMKNNIKFNDFFIFLENCGYYNAGKENNKNVSYISFNIWNNKNIIAFKVNNLFFDFVVDKNTFYVCLFHVIYNKQYTQIKLRTNIGYINHNFNHNQI